MGSVDKSTQEVQRSLDEQLDNEPSEIIGWDDISNAIIAARLDTSTGRLDYDYFNAGVNFNSNARYPDEPVVIPIQLWHRLKYGSGAVLRPHFHWLQEQSAVPNFILAYKKTSYGTATVKETDFTNYTLMKWDSNVFTYPGSGVFAQITKFPEIDISDMTISGSVDIVLFRDSADASGLFGASDPVGTDVTVKYNDSHAQLNQERGSRQEYIK